MNSKIIDLSNDAGFELLTGILKEGKLMVDGNVDLDQLLMKQAYAPDFLFADPVNRKFSIATAAETEISARYAEKIAGLDDSVIVNINEAASVFGIDPVVTTKMYPVGQDQFKVASENPMEKYAGVTSYGTELDTCLAARAMLFPDQATELEALAKLASEVSPDQMVEMIKTADAILGADAPHIQAMVMPAEYAVYEKRASGISVTLGKKEIGIEKLAELQEVMDDMGISLDFDADDPYSIKLAVERLPEEAKEAIALYL